MNITHIAWLGDKNYGDDLMAEALRNYLINLFDDPKFYIWCEGEPETSKNKKSIHPFNSKIKFLNSYFEKKVLKNTEMLIVGGGSILRKENSIKWKNDAIIYMKNKNPKAKAVGIGLSLEELKTIEGQRACNGLLANLDAVSLRDNRSYEYVKKLNFKNKLIKASDLAFFYFKSIYRNKKIYSNKIDCLGIALKENKSNQQDINIHVKLLKELCSKYEKVKLFSLYGGNISGDNQYINKLFEETNAINLVPVFYDGRISEFTDEIIECDFFISTRLHGLIASFALGIPFISLAYHQKCYEFLKDIKLSKEYIFDFYNFDINSVVGKINLYKLPEQKEFFELSQNNFKVFEV